MVSMSRVLLGVVMVAACWAVAGTSTAQVEPICIPGIPIEGCPDPGTGPTGPGGQPQPPPQPPTPPAKPCALHKSKGRSVFSGLVGEQIYSDTGNYRTCALSAAAAAGVRMIRQPLRWSTVEPVKGVYDYSYWDAYLAELARRRLRVMPILSEPPAFRSSAPATGAKRGVYPPRESSAMAAFAVKMVRRYGPDGSFWRLHRDLPKIPIRTWQVWNEPNLPFYWAPKPDARAYTKLLGVVGRAIKRADPKAEIVSAGIPQSKIRGAVPQRVYLRRMYRAGLAKYADTIAIHSYTETHSDFVKQVKGIRALMHTAGDKAPLWITEIGWASGGPDKRFTPGPKGQARRIDRTFRFLARERKTLRIRGLMYYMWQDAEPVPGFRDYWGLHTGLLDKQGAAKPAMAAYKRRALKLKNAR